MSASAIVDLGTANPCTDLHNDTRLGVSVNPASIGSHPGETRQFVVRRDTLSRLALQEGLPIADRPVRNEPRR
jgi:hypothetical protein